MISGTMTSMTGTSPRTEDSKSLSPLPACMPPKSEGILYYVFTGLLSLVLLLSALLFFSDLEWMEARFPKLGFPTYLVLPLAFAKIGGATCIWFHFFPTLKYLAYAGVFFDFSMAAVSYTVARDGENWIAFIAIAILVTSYVFDRRRQMRKAYTAKDS